MVISRALQKIKIQAKSQWEQLYEGICTVYSYQQKYNPTKHCTTVDKVVTAENVPCRCSLASAVKANQSDSVALVSQEITLYLAPDVEVKAGSEIIVTQAGWTTRFKASGQPRVYTSHQEISLTIAGDKA